MSKKTDRPSAFQGDDAAAIDLVLKMLAIPGKSGQEAAVADFIVQQLKSVGYRDAQIQFDSAHKKSPIRGQVGNLILKLPGTVRGPRRMLMAHIDTVPICAGCEPVLDGALIRPKQRTTGLGGDDRAGASVILHTVLNLARNNTPHPPLTVLWAVQEEIGLVGARYVDVKKLGDPKSAFNWDGGSACLVTRGATGDYGIEIEVTGIAAHAGAHPEGGVSAIAIASIAIADLVQNGWHGLIEKGRKRGTSNVGVIHGGDATNVVTPTLTLRAEARSHDPVFRKKIVDEIQKAFERAAKSLKNIANQRGSIRFNADLKYEAFCLPEDEPTVQAAVEAVSMAGLLTELRISNGGLDANWMTAHGIPTVTLGCGQAGIHTVDEILHVDSYLKGCQIAKWLATKP
jgi:tripeptide aminopeptidase